MTRRDLGIRPYVALGLAVMAVSSSALLIRLSTAPPVVVASYRMAFVTILLAPLALHFQRQDFGQLRGLNLWRLLAAGACLALHFACWTASLQFTSVASSVVLVSTHPMFVAIAESVWLRRPISRVGLAGIALSMFGGLVIGADELRQGGTSPLGCALALGGAIAMVGYLTLGRTLRAHLGFLSYSTAAYAACGGLLLATTLLSGENLMAITATDLVLFGLLALIPTLGGHLVFNWTLRYLPASVISTSFLGEPVGAASLAYLFLRETPEAPTLIGGAVILIGLYMTMRYA